MRQSTKAEKPRFIIHGFICRIQNQKSWSSHSFLKFRFVVFFLLTNHTIQQHNHATGIKDARSLIEHYNFDLAIIDMQLPDGTGFDVSEIFKNK